MANAPYSSVVSPLNPTFIDWPLSSFLTTAGATPPTATTGYARYTVIGNLVHLEFKYVLATLGTTGVQYRLNLPIPMVDTIGGTRQKVQGSWYVRYSGGTGLQHEGSYGDVSGTDSKVLLQAQTSYGSTLSSFTSASPHALAIGDFIHGVMNYEIA